MSLQSKVYHIIDVLEVIPKRVTRIGGRATVYLGRKLNFLIGRDVIVVVKVLDGSEEDCKNSTQG